MTKNILIKLSNYLRISEKFLIQFIIKFNINLLPLKKTKMAYELKELQGSLFKNSKKTTELHPDYTGKLKVNGVELMLSAWVAKTKAGETYLNIKAKEAMPSVNTGSQDNFGAKGGTDLPF